MQSKENDVPENGFLPVQKKRWHIHVPTHWQKKYTIWAVIAALLIITGIYGLMQYTAQEAHKKEVIKTALDLKAAAEGQPYGVENGGEAGHFALLATYSMNAADYKAALDDFKKAQASLEKQNIPANQLSYLASIAEAYSKMGDKANAKTYFQKAIDAIKKADATGSADYIKQLEKMRDAL